MCSRYTYNKDGAKLRLRDKIIRVIPPSSNFGVASCGSMLRCLVPWLFNCLLRVEG